MKYETFLLAVGANQPSSTGSPRETLEKALKLLAERGIEIVAVSDWRRTPAYPPGAGPDFVNGAAVARSEIGAEAVLAALHEVERELGRERRKRWAPRVCDLDLIACGERIAPDLQTVERLIALGPEAADAPAPDCMVLPHPRVQDRSFVLAPLMDVAPDWRHPVLGLTVREMYAHRPADERNEISMLDEDPAAADEIDGEDALAEAYDRALALEKAGHADEAAAAYREVLRLDPADHGGAAVRLAAIGRGAAPDSAPEAYVATLFDQHAEMFDTILVDQLGYAVPMTLRERLDALELGPFTRMLDLGCGTGLAAVALEDRTDWRTGVDLAPAMVEIAGEDELYGELYVGEAVRFLQETAAPPWDLITAMDVLPYIGKVEPLFAAVATRLGDGGLFAFSTETLPAAEMADADWRVTPHHRYAHSADHVGARLAAAGLRVLEMTDITVRRESGAPIKGHLTIAVRD